MVALRNGVQHASSHGPASSSSTLRRGVCRSSLQRLAVRSDSGYFPVNFPNAPRTTVLTSPVAPPSITVRTARSASARL